MNLSIRLDKGRNCFPLFFLWTVKNYVTVACLLRSSWPSSSPSPTPPPCPPGTWWPGWAGTSTWSSSSPSWPLPTGRGHCDCSHSSDARCQRLARAKDLLSQIDPALSCVDWPGNTWVLWREVHSIVMWLNDDKTKDWTRVWLGSQPIIELTLVFNQPQFGRVEMI